ncbi:DUF5071 domain-containing protein [Paenibacillus sp. DMB5]|uniref:DUF5071 domain-containing protein n=1 Tax=Paenibacillus sp. DMB5 TaxID=1780103 RepID=UPI0012FFB713|nr:DUF5071 domain-containing protein [Paenibacillus sp. DMB5]
MKIDNLPTDKHDFKSVELLAGLEESQVIPLIPKLLEWVQDINWPIAAAVADLLQKYKVHTVSHIEAVFLLRNDSIWIYNILAYLMNEWDSRSVSALSSSILKLAQAPDVYEDTDLLAVEMLWKHRLITKKAAAVLLETKLSDTEGMLNRFTAEQRNLYQTMENERLHILGTDPAQMMNHLLNYSDETFGQKRELENLLRRQEEIAATINRIME